MNNDDKGRESNTPPTLSKYSSELDYEDEEDERQDTCSLFSDDSVFPYYEDAPSDSEDHQEVTLYWCCARNNAKRLQDKLDMGVTREEAMELDINGQVIDLTKQV